jgi:Domain of unknown function (DUF4365)
MPARPDSHEVGDRAIAEVQRIIAGAGLIAEVVEKDYGEDLLVNVTIEGTVQPARFWVQVKGRRNVAALRRRDGTLALELSTDHLVRWSQSADPVLVVLWSVEDGIGWWEWVDAFDAMPKLGDESQAFKTVRIPAGHQFDVAAARTTAMEALLEHFARAVMQVRAVEAWRSTENDDTAGEFRLTRGEIALDALRSLGVLNGFTPVRFFVETLYKAYHNLPGKDDEDPDDRWRLAVTVAVLRTAHERAPVPISELLAYELVNTMLGILEGIKESMPS